MTLRSQALVLSLLAGVVAIDRIAAQRPLAGGVRLAQLRVVAAIVDGAATTELRQMVCNDGNRIAEASFVLPLPDGAIADGFTMTVDGVAVAGEVLDAQRARGVYESIVRRKRDPGLLEYVGSGCLRARVFPIPPAGQSEVCVRYRQILTETAGLHRWSFPVRAPYIGSARPESISAELHIRSSVPIKNVFSPLSSVDIVVHGDREARASFETTGGQTPDRDLSVFYGLSEREFGINLLTYRKQAKAPGYFLLMLSPKQSWAEEQITRKSIQFVLDTSGSMQGPKIQQARGALRFFLRSLKPHDEFNVVPFSTEARPFFPAPVRATEAHVQAALALVDDIEARGGTHIEDALTTALAVGAPDEYLPITVFLTDGRPTVGTTDQKRLLRKIEKANRGAQRVFVFGVGHDVNTHLLDRVAATTRGARDYVAEDEDIEVKTGSLFTKLAHPVLTDVELRIDGVFEKDLMPRQMPDLFRGSRMLVLGRYKGHGGSVIRLRGKYGVRREEFVYHVEFPRHSTEHDFVPVLWAERRVATLLDAIRLNGQDRELLAEVRLLGTEYGIATPYTSHLIVEEATRLGGGTYRGPGHTAIPGGGGGRGPGSRGPSRTGPRGPTSPGPSGPATGGPAARLDPLAEARVARERLRDLGKNTTGKGAVADSQNIVTGSDEFFVGGSRRATQLETKKAARRITRRVVDKTFYLVDKLWMDAKYDKKMADKIEKIEAFSDEYFALLKATPELAPYLSFAERVLMVWGKRVIEITA